MAPLPGPDLDTQSTADLTALIQQRRRQVVTKRLLILGAVLVIAALFAIAWFSPLLGLRTVKVSGGELVDHDTVRTQVLAAHQGTPLPQLRPGVIEDEILAEFPRAESVSVHYAGPRSLRLQLTDRRAVIAVAAKSGYRLYDKDAIDLGTVKKAPQGLTVMDGSGAAGAQSQEAVAAVIEFMAALDEKQRAQLLTLTAESADELAGTIKAGGPEQDSGNDNESAAVRVVFGDSSDAALKLGTAVQLAAVGRTRIDVSVPSVPVTN